MDVAEVCLSFSIFEHRHLVSSILLMLGRWVPMMFCFRAPPVLGHIMLYYQAGCFLLLKFPSEIQLLPTHILLLQLSFVQTCNIKQISLSPSAVNSCFVSVVGL